jgi:ABC-type multidrug transport system fused ATPase/permease subunit
VPQTPWLFSASVRDNILFGEPFDRDKFQKVTAACALTKDLALLPFGEETLVGDRGITLSGGQKARIGLAR